MINKQPTIFLIVGESGCGKTTIVKELENRYGLKTINSYTTRPRRKPNEEGHIFITPEEFYFPSNQNYFAGIVGYTEFNGHKYFATSDQVDDCDTYVIDVEGIKTIKKLYKGKKQIKVIYISVPEEERFKRMTDRQSAKEAEERIKHDRIAFKDVYDYVDFIVSNHELETCIEAIYQYIQWNSPRKLVVGIDVDNVLNNLTEVWIKVLNSKYNYDVKLSDVKHYNIRKAYPTLTDKQLFEPLYNDKFWRMTKPPKGSQKWLRKLNDEYDVRLVTSTHPATVLQKYKYIKRYFPYIKFDQIEIVHDKKRYKMDVLVEDYDENLKYGDFVRILITYPWNKSINDEVFKIKRVQDWHGIYNAIKNIKPCGKDVEDVECFDCNESYDSNGVIVCGHKR